MKTGPPDGREFRRFANLPGGPQRAGDLPVGDEFDATSSATRLSSIVKTPALRVSTNRRHSSTLSA